MSTILPMTRGNFKHFLFYSCEYFIICGVLTFFICFIDLSSFAWGSDALVLKDNPYASRILDLDVLEGRTLGDDSRRLVPLEVESDLLPLHMEKHKSLRNR